MALNSQRRKLQIGRVGYLRIVWGTFRALPCIPWLKAPPSVDLFLLRSTESITPPVAEYPAEGPDLSPAESVPQGLATRGAWTESLDRFWTCPEMFFAQCFQESREDSG